jgi:hypothetical protein
MQWKFEAAIPQDFLVCLQFTLLIISFIICPYTACFSTSYNDHVKCKKFICCLFEHFFRNPASDSISIEIMQKRL